ncbi:hypothetical protein EBAPG3_014195 [Nitrosospira lacus]|uniref:ParB/Sulfiredoxin domain-containing protein n=1 Tax=Nitrosospira lacus TaxID=1288494 RepID=A0A1W6SSP6_9PROT|nr:ParB/Srx family N-terminal domain-containing protein [Nitrosospira lacus]ARO88827.1 hypothetical protein EBAPG3_014195 [Nitrosospira lacus]
MKIKINQIELNELTQSRVEINSEIVSDYEEAYHQGVRLPDIKVYFDGDKHWLADGYHRYHAASKIGLLEIDADMVQGTRRDAILYSVRANSEHGLRRTHADKRKAVQTLLTDTEWSTWSNNEIAKRCAVSHTLVNELRRTLEAASSIETITNNESGEGKRKFLTSTGKTAEMKTANIGSKLKPAHSEEPPKDSDASAEPTIASGQISSIPEGMMLVSKEEYDEMILTYQEVLDENTSMQKLFDSIDGLPTAMAEIKRLNEYVKTLERRINGLLNEKNEVIRLVKWWQRKCGALEKKVKDLEVQVKNYQKDIVQF